MNIDTILKFFVPKDNSFYPLFEEASDNLVKAAEQLKLLVISEEFRDKGLIIVKIIESGRAGNEIALKTYNQLDKSFITPFEREDIHDLVCSLNDLLNSIIHISKSIGFYHPVKLDPFYSDLTEIIFQTTRMIDVCLNYLRVAGENKRSIIIYCNDLKSIVGRAKEIFYSGISLLLEKEKDITEVIKNKEILENFENCFDKTSTVSSTIKSMLLRIQ